MNSSNDKHANAEETIRHDLGTFEGFNFRSQSAIERNLTADEVVGWDHDQQGEAEFWPSGDKEEVAVLFHGKSSVTSSELISLDELLKELGGDSTENFLRIHYAVNTCGSDLAGVTRDEVEDVNLNIYIGSSLHDLRKEAAYELFEVYYPEEHRIWDKGQCDALHFDTDDFLDSPSFSVEEIDLGSQKALLVAPE